MPRRTPRARQRHAPQGAHDREDHEAARQIVELRARHPVFDRCRYDIGRQRKKTFTRLKTDRVVRLAAKEFGQKLYGNLQPQNKFRFMRSAKAIDALHDVMGRGCTGRHCSPKQAMLAGVEGAKVLTLVERFATEMYSDFSAK